MFTHDLAEGRAVERLVIPYLERLVPGSEAWKSKLNPYITDLWWRLEVGAKPVKVEVKYQRMTPQTGNVCLEYKSLLNTTSEYVVNVIPPNIVCLNTTKKIRLMLPLYKQVNGGDQGHKLSLVPQSQFLSNCLRLQ